MHNSFRDLTKLWKEIFPIEMYYGSLALLSSRVMRYIMVYYLLTTLFAIIYFSYVIYFLIRDGTSTEHIPRVIMLQIQNLVYVLMPYMTYYYYYRCNGEFSKSPATCRYLYQLFRTAQENDSYLQLKYRLVSHLNVFLLLFSIIIYAATAPDSIPQIFVAVLLSVTYFFPFCWGYTFNIFIMEAFRLRALHFSAQLKSLINTELGSSSDLDLLGVESISCLKNDFEITTTSSSRNKNDFHEKLLPTNQLSDANTNTSLENGNNGNNPLVSVLQIGQDMIPLGINNGEQTILSRDTTLPNFLSSSDSSEIVSLIRQRYLKETRDCLCYSQQYGKFLLFLFGTALVFAISAVWGIYLDHDNTVSTFPFVVISLNLVGQLGLTIAGANEAGNLVCRDISYFLLTNPEGKEERERKQSESLLLLQCMQYSKLEIPFVGGFTLRSKTILTILGSIIGAIIPGLLLRK